MMVKIVRQFWIYYNRLNFRLNGIIVGKGTLIFNKLYLRKNKYSSIEIGKNFAFSSGSGFNPLNRNIRGAIETEKGAKIIIGDSVGISSSCLWAFDFIRIGSRTKIGADCIILDSDAHSLDYRERRSFLTDRPHAQKKGIVIGEDVLIGTRCIILKGVTIGDRSIIGSGSVVVKSIPEDCVAAGNPAKVIKQLRLENTDE